MIQQVNNKKEKLQNLLAQRDKLKKNKNTKLDNNLPKTLESCENQIEKLRKSIEADEYKIKIKDDNKNVALGTSKINYMDPRITIGWCKNFEVPIERVFPKTLRSKFAWAMGVEPAYQF